MPKTQLNAFKSMFLIRISNNLLIYKIDQINQISIPSFYFLHFLPQSISARSFLPFFFRNIFPHYLFITCCFRRRSSAKVPNFPLWIWTFYHFQWVRAGPTISHLVLYKTRYFSRTDGYCVMLLCQDHMCFYFYFHGCYQAL